MINTPKTIQTTSSTQIPRIMDLFEVDPLLKPYEHEIRRRFGCMQSFLETIERQEGGLDVFTRAYLNFGLQIDSRNNITILEWAPGARNVYLRGEFNEWKHDEFKFEQVESGKWRLVIPALKDGSCAIKHGSIFKLVIETSTGEKVDRLCPWAKYVVKQTNTQEYEMSFYNPSESEKYRMKYERPLKPTNLKIYEINMDIQSPEPRMTTYTYFRDVILPKIKKQGYNAVQLMGVMEHATYTTFGHQTSSFFAASSRFGTPEELKSLIDEAHRLGLCVYLDLVHNKFVNAIHGLFTHSIEKGFHTLWESRVLNFTQIETLRFLLSNIRFWMDEYKLDGFKFNGVSQMLYHSHSEFVPSFGGNYEQFFSKSVDQDNLVFLMLANYLVHRLYPTSLTIAEECLGMPTLCRPIEEGGLGFDYRLAMNIPEKWEKLIKESKEEDWSMTSIVSTLFNRRFREPVISYTDSHDPAVVGTKPIAFSLMGPEVYTNMTEMSPLTPRIERGIALYKMIHLITCGLGGEAWLNFMGNEFGSPEWLDVPRELQQRIIGTDRQLWSLVEDVTLRFRYLNKFEQDMNKLEDEFKWLSCMPVVSRQSEVDKVIVFERAGLLWVFNFHPTKTFTNYTIGCDKQGKYKVILNTEDKLYGGRKHIEPTTEIMTLTEGYDNRKFSLRIPSIPCRSAMVLGLNYIVKF